MRYSDEFKNHVVSRLLTGEVTIPQAQEQYGVSTFSLREWRKKALSQASESSAAETHAQESPQIGICQDTSKKLVRSLFIPEEPQQGLCPYASLPLDIFLT